MTDAQAIDAANLYWLNLGSQLTADDTSWQARGAFHLQQVVNEFWRKPWPWKRASGSITVATTGIAPLPTDFGTIGGKGMLVNRTTLRRLKYEDPIVLFRMREKESGTSSDPLFYTISGIDTATGYQQLHTHQKPPANLALTIYYEKQRPTVSYGGTGLGGIPIQYHEDILVDGVIARLAFDEGDPRAPEMTQRYRQAIASAWTEAKIGLQEPSRAPGYGRRAVFSGGWR